MRRSSEAVAMLVREKLTGQKAPESAGKVLDLWRPFIEDKAGGDLDNLSSVIEDQQAFSRVVRHMLSAMEMAEDMGDDEEQERGRAIHRRGAAAQRRAGPGEL